MQTIQPPLVAASPPVSKTRRTLKAMYQNRWLYVLALPGILFFLVFRIAPIFGIIISFQNYSPFLGVLNSPWVGLEHFQKLFASPDFLKMLRNTLGIGFTNLLLYYPLPIILAIMLSEVRNLRFKRFTQSVIYIPHFMSWVVVYALTVLLFAKGSGIVNELLDSAGLGKIDVLTNPKAFWLVLAIQNIWKDAGWGTVVFLAAIVGIDAQLYEAAKMDGASKLQQMLHITLPGITGVIVVTLILRVGQIMSVGFEQIYLMSNAAVSDFSEVFDLVSYRMGIQQGQLSYSTAIGLFKSVVGIILITLSDRIAKRLGHSGVF